MLREESGLEDEEDEGCWRKLGGCLCSFEDGRCGFGDGSESIVERSWPVGLGMFFLGELWAKLWASLRTVNQVAQKKQQKKRRRRRRRRRAETK